MPRKRRLTRPPPPPPAMSHSGVRVVNFTGPVTNVVITDSPPNVIPKAGIFFAVQSGSLSNALAQTGRLSIGFADNAVLERCVMIFGENGAAAASADTGYRIDTSTVVQISGTSGVGLLSEANVTEFITNGCILSWTGGNIVPGQAVFFYGDDVEVSLVQFSGNATEDSSSSISGLSFAPDMVFLASVNQTFVADGQGAEGMLTFGFAARSSDTQACSCVVWEDEENPTSSGVITRDDSVVVKLTSAGGTITEGARLEVTSWNSDGVTFTTREESHSLQCMALCVKMPNTSAWAGAPLFDADTAGAFSRTDPNFLPQALIFSGVRTTATATVGSGQGTLCVAATDAYSTGEVGTQARDNRATSETGVDWSTTRSFAIINVPGSGSHDWHMTWTSFDTLGWSGSVGLATAADRIVAYMAISLPRTIIGNETVNISEGVVFQQNPLRALSETVNISEAHVFVQNAVGGAGGVVNETVQVSEGLVLKIVLVLNETEQIDDGAVLEDDLNVYNDTEEIHEGLVLFGDATLVANETEQITEGSALLITGFVLVVAETVNISEEYNDGPGPVLLKRGARGTTLSAGSEAGGLLTAGAERGTVRG